MSRLKIWQRIPDGSTLELSTQSASPFTAGVRIVDEVGNETKIPAAKLTPGPAKKTLHSPKAYVASVCIAFTATKTSTVTLLARVIKPNGQIHGKAFTMTVMGKKGDVRRANVIAKTVGSST